MTSVPVWVRFSSLHLKFWSREIISKIAGLIGMSIFMDRATSNFEKLAYARSFIEISAAKSLPKTVSIELEEGERVFIDVEYEWAPPICAKCKTFGHIDSQCPSIKVWRPKADGKSVESQSGVIEQSRQHSEPEHTVERQPDQSQVEQVRRQGEHILGMQVQPNHIKNQKEQGQESLDLNQREPVKECHRQECA